MVLKIDEPNQKERIAREILLRLPDWFGVPESTQDYIYGCREKPFWAVFNQSRAYGFIALKETSPDTVEIYVMGVLPEYHRKGAGKALFDALVTYAKANNYSFLQVKTVRKGSWSSYDKTNDFYIAMGMKELECFPEYWDEKNPCQIYIKAI